MSFRFRGDVMIIEVLHFSYLSDSSRSSNHMVDPFWLPTTGVTGKVLKSFKVMRSGLVTVVCQDLEIVFTIFYRIWRVLWKLCVLQIVYVIITRHKSTTYWAGISKGYSFKFEGTDKFLSFRASLPFNCWRFYKCPITFKFNISTYKHQYCLQRFPKCSWNIYVWITRYHQTNCLEQQTDQYDNSLTYTVNLGTSNHWKTIQSIRIILTLTFIMLTPSFDFEDMCLMHFGTKRIQNLQNNNPLKWNYQNIVV